MKLRNLNDFLDQLVRDDSRDGKAAILGKLIIQTTPDQMAWICRIILHDLKVISR